MKQGNKDLDYGLGDLVVCKNKMISTVIIQVFNPRKQMASVCYHSFCRKQRLRSQWCWRLVPSGCWMWPGKEWKTAKTTALCTAKVNAGSFLSLFASFGSWARQARTKWAGMGMQSETWSTLFLFSSRISLTCVSSRAHWAFSVQDKTESVIPLMT